MTNTAEQLDVEELPAGGIGDFVMSDEDFRVLERQNAEKEYGSQGIARFEETASRIAAYGRFGDDQVVHVETGELVVPRKLIEQSPELKESIFRHLREAGIEDPERYVVGSAENSINPETGLMEFGFFSKIFKGIKKAVKKVGKVLKKYAPIILAIAAPYALPAMGITMAPAFATALGSGVGTLIQGGSIKDAFKSALLAGGTYGVFSGASEAMSGGSFAEGFGGAFKAPPPVASAVPEISDLSMTPERIEAANIAAGEGLAPVYESGKLVSDVPLTPGQALDDAIARGAARNRASVNIDPTKSMIGDTGISVAEADAAAARLVGKEGAVLNENVGLEAAVNKSRAAQLGQQAQSLGQQAQAGAGTSTGFFGNLGEAGSDILQGDFRGSLTNLKEAFLPSLAEGNPVQIAFEKGFIKEATPEAFGKLATSLQNEAIQAAKVTMGQRALAYAPAAIGLGAATGFFETPPMEEAGLVDRDAEGNVISGLDLIEQNPFKYRVYPTGFTPTYVPPSDALVPYTPPQMAAEGGEIFPRRTGGIMPDEGIPNEDSVKAMLMPGEFVMTTTAVRGLGDGDLNKGINNMYSVMRNLEARGRATA